MITNSALVPSTFTERMTLIHSPLGERVRPVLSEAEGVRVLPQW